MFDQIPTSAWLLLVIAAAAFPPARYVYNYLSKSPARRDITLPPEDLSWRTSLDLGRNLAILVALGGVAIFIFTPTARQFAQSELFISLLAAAGGAWSLVTAAFGFWARRLQPFARGFHDSYDRATQPKRYWASMAWNGFFGCLALGLALFLFRDIPNQAIEDRCFDVDSDESPQAALSACNELIGKGGSDDAEKSSFIAARGSAYYRAGDFEHARTDYSVAARLDPEDSSAYFNLGLVDQRMGNLAAAAANYSIAIRLGSDGADSFYNRGLVNLGLGKFDDATSDFTRAHQLQPKDPWAIANRGMAYALQNQPLPAERDFVWVQAIDPTNLVMLRGQALLSLNKGDLPGVVANLSAVLKRDPADRWSRRLRADAYEKLGQEEASLSDRDELWRMSRTANEGQRGN